jgi:uncharacterized membrane protein YgaE (UPF0421/DUF939 family)
MSRQVGNVSSKYYFDPIKFDKDIKENQEKYKNKKHEIYLTFKELLIKYNPADMEETIHLMINAVRSLKEEFQV